MQKVLIIGSGGAGKSTLARALGERLDLPVVHLDRHYWHPGWQPTPKDAWRAIVQDLIRRDRWIMDGNYGGTFDIRFPEADTIIDLDFNRWTCLSRAIRRSLLYPVKGRPDMIPGCPDRLFALDFYRWIWRFRSDARLRIERAYTAYAARTTVYQFRRPAELSRWLAALGASSTLQADGRDDEFVRDGKGIHQATGERA